MTSSADEHGSRIRDVGVAGRLPRLEGLQVVFEFLADEMDRTLLPSLALADHQQSLAVAREAFTDLDAGDLRGAKAAGAKHIELGPGANGHRGASLVRLKGRALV